MRFGDLFSVRNTAAFSLLASAALSFTAVNAEAATIKIQDYLVNPSFEAAPAPGTPPVVCPIGWSCGGSPAPGAGNYTVTTDQYTPGANGLPAGLLVPHGTQAGFSPTTISGSGSLSQNIPTLVYEAGNTYEFSFWVGLPNTVPGGATNCGIPNTSCLVDQFPDVVNLYFTSGLTLAGNGLPGPFAVENPGDGMWKLQTVSFVAQAGAGYIGTRVGINFFVASNNNGRSVNFDILSSDLPPPGTPFDVPEPASMTLLGLGLAGITARLRRKHA